MPDETENWDSTRTVRISSGEHARRAAPNDTYIRESAQTNLSSEYSVLEKIGDGGMGVVYLARDNRLGRYVAIKRLKRATLSEATFRKRFSREAKSVAALNHIYIVHIYVLGEDSDGPYIVMEYVAGPAEASPKKVPPSPLTLADRVNRDGPMQVNEALDLLLKLCRAVEYAHSCGVIHRDLKPSNVLFDGSSEPKIVDFGLARKLGPQDEDLTVTGEKMLSLGYGAPEQEVDASLADERSDVYGLGALLYFSVTGKNPRYFRTEDIPEGLAAPVTKALEPDRNKRCPSAREFGIALMEIKAPSTIELPTVKTTWRCKWCDTVNPVMIRYCGKCGWDGGEKCLECDAETRSGIQFCGACGANAREYEMAGMLLARLRSFHDEKAYEPVLQQAGQISGFHPVGPKGHYMIAAIQELSAKAEKALKRRRDLREEIAREIEEGSYERALASMDEYDKLSSDNEFESERRDLPRRIAERELKRASDSVAGRQWIKAERILADPASRIPAQDPTAARLLKRINRHKRRKRIEFMFAALIGSCLLYIMSDAAVFGLLGKRNGSVYRTVYAPVRYLRNRTFLRPIIDEYAAFWGVEQMYSDSAPGAPAAHAEPSPVRPTGIRQVETFKQQYLKSIEHAETRYNQSIGSWPGEYEGNLKAAQKKMQQDGDFEGWFAVTQELKRFGNTRELAEYIPDSWPDDLVRLRSRYSSLIEEYRIARYKAISKAARQYVEQLAKLQRQLTKEGKMAQAQAVNEEIKKTESNAELAHARAVIEQFETEQKARREAAEQKPQNSGG